MSRLTHPPLWQHQKRLVAGFTGLQIIHAGVGTGKTLTALKIAEDARRFLIICLKNNIEDVWVKAFDDFAPDFTVYPLLSGTSKTKGALVRDAWANTPEFAVVVNYETAWRIEDLGSYPWDIVILDESHKIKNYRSATSRRLARMFKDQPRKLLLTGTGWDDRPSDVFGQIRFLLPLVPPRARTRVHSQIFGSYEDFMNRYADFTEPHPGVMIPRRWKRLGELANRVAPYVTVVKSEDVLDLPESMDIVRYVSLPKPVKTEYERLRDDYIARWEDDSLTVAENALTASLRLLQVVQGHTVDTEGNLVLLPSEKLNALADILDEIGDEPAIIYSRFRYDVSRITDLLEQRDQSYSLLTGDVKDYGTWEKGRTQFLVANIAAGSTGLNAQRARVMIFFGLDHSNTDHTQARGRIMRDKSTRPEESRNLPCLYYYIVARDTIDVDIVQALREKRTLTEQIVRGIIGNKGD